MLCPNCNELVDLEDWIVGSPLRCDSCKEWLRLEISMSDHGWVRNKYLVIVAGHDEDGQALAE